MKRVKIAAISYLNSVPFVYGIKHADYNLCVDLLLRKPQECLTLFESKECDIAIVSLASTIGKSDVNIVTDYSISSSGDVRTVKLLSNSHISEITDIYLDSESYTSAILIRILAEQYWNINPNWHDIKYDNCEFSPKKGNGFLMIGDKVFDWENKFEFNVDLAGEWLKFTTLPFVFAVWVARNDIDRSTIIELNKALEFGTNHIDDAINWANYNIDKDSAKDYLTNNIEFLLNEKKRLSIEMFRTKAMQLKNMEFSSPMPIV